MRSYCARFSPTRSQWFSFVVLMIREFSYYQIKRVLTTLALFTVIVLYIEASALYQAVAYNIAMQAD